MTRLLDWCDRRYDTRRWLDENLFGRRIVEGNPWPYRIGILALAFLALQLTTGVLLLVHYVPTVDGVNEAMRLLGEEVEFGWLVQGLHLVGASIVVGLSVLYLLLVLLRGTYKNPRELLWFFLVLSFVVLLAEGYTGNVLVWGERGRQAAAVGTGMVETLPVIGESGARMLRGGDDLGGPSLRRFFVLHVLVLPVLLVCLVRAILGLIRRLRHADPRE